MNGDETARQRKLLREIMGVLVEHERAEAAVSAGWLAGARALLEALPLPSLAAKGRVAQAVSSAIRGPQGSPRRLTEWEAIVEEVAQAGLSLQAPAKARLHELASIQQLATHLTHYWMAYDPRQRFIFRDCTALLAHLVWQYGEPAGTAIVAVDGFRPWITDQAKAWERLSLGRGTRRAWIDFLSLVGMLVATRAVREIEEELTAVWRRWPELAPEALPWLQEALDSYRGDP